MRDILAILPKEALKPEVLNKLRDRQEATVRIEKQRTLEHIPSWREEKARNADIELMQATLADYGFDESFLHSILDHRAIKFVRDMSLMRKRIRDSIASVRDPKRLGKTPSGKTGKGALKPNVQSSRKVMPTQNDKLAELFKE